MDDETVAVIAAEETERREDAGDTAVELARIEQENVETRAETDLAIVEAQADAAVEIATAQAEGNDEWRTEAATMRAQMSEMALSQSQMAEAISALAQAQIAPLIQTPPNPPGVDAADLEEVETVEESPPEATSESPTVRPEKRRVRRLM